MKEDEKPPMSLTRRKAIKLLASALPAAVSARAVGASALFSKLAPFQSQIAPGPFIGTEASLSRFEIPDWFKEAKFGIWAHWGPQSAAEAGDWYARNIYIQGSRQNKFHIEHYGHPSTIGHKDLIQTWRGDKFDPDHLMGLYKKAGAQYFMTMGVHHDNFDLWNSRYTRWNAVKMGIKKDVVGLWRKAALKQAIPFGVSDHLWISYKWFAVSHRSDKDGPLAGVPYDGADPKFADLYHDYRQLPAIPPVDFGWNEDGIPDSWKQHWFLRIKDMIDQYQPDMIYSDGHIPFGDIGLNLVAHLYNTNAKNHGGVPLAVYTSKRKEDSDAGICVLDVERGLVENISPQPYQTDTCIGDWHYNRDIVYKTPKRVIDMLVDVVSRNGNLMLNFPLPNSGMLDDRELHILDEITRWMDVNGEAIFATTPWKIFGAGPGTKASAAPGGFNEGKRQDLTVEDVRFTIKMKTLYAFAMGWPDPAQTRSVNIAPLAKMSQYMTGKISNVELLGYGGKLIWNQDDSGLHIQLPEVRPSDYAIAFRISGLTFF